MQGNSLKIQQLKNNLIGDKAFYRRVVAILLPIVIQNTVTNVVSLLDNLMVGAVGNLEMSAVSVVNQLLFIFYLCIFGGLAGAGIFAADRSINDYARDIWHTIPATEKK
jgi:Na+-driven multidrug efflux pump